MVSKKQRYYSRIPKSVGKKIQKLRQDKNLSQVELAERLGLSPTYIGYIEQGARNPSISTLDKIARIFRVRMSDLLD